MDTGTYKLTLDVPQLDLSLEKNILQPGQLAIATITTGLFVKDTMYFCKSDGTYQALQSGPYVLPQATTSVNGGVSVPVLSGLDIQNGILGMNVDGNKGLELNGTTGALGLRLAINGGLEYNVHGELQLTGSGNK